MISLIDKLKAMKQTKFSFISFERVVGSADDNGNQLIHLVFELADPIEKVTSSTTLYDPSGGVDKRINPFKVDVMFVKCNLDVIGKYEKDFIFDEVNGELTKTGSYEGDLFLDLSRHDDVWLTDVKFSKFAQDKRREERGERFQKFFQAGLEKTGK